MTKIKLCGLRRPEDVAAANALGPDYVGFVFAKKSRRRVSPGEAAALKALLRPGIRAAGVFADEAPETIAALLNEGIIDLAQLHGREDGACIARLRRLTDKALIQAFRVASPADVERAEKSEADHILLDAGAGGGVSFDWALLRPLRRPFFLAGGLNAENVARAVEMVRPYGVDVSSGIETNGAKDPEKMRAFVAAVREKESR